VAFAFLSEKLAAVRLRHWIAFGGIVGCVAGPWFVTAAVKDPQFLQEFIYTHNIRRFAGAFHVQPFWYFVPVGLVGGHPWTMLLVPYGLFLLSRNREVGVMRPPAMGFLLLWGGWCFLFFSASQCKLPTYILPIAPAFALLVAHYLDCALWRVPRMRSFGGGQLLAPRLSAVTSCVAALGAGAAAYKLQLATGGFVVVSTLVWTVLLALVTAVCFRRRDARVAWLVGFSVAMLLMWQVTQVWVPEFGRSQMVMSPRNDDAPWLRDDEQVVATFAHEWSAIPFYSRRNDIRNFKESGRLAEFVANHARTLIVSTTRQDLSRLRQLLPNSTQLTLLQQVPYGQIILAENDVGVQASAAARSDLDRR
jgi:dolichol-phosphate mannosyltransferase